MLNRLLINRYKKQQKMVRQREVFISAMQNYDKVLKLTKESMESNGKAQEKYDTYLESTDAKLNKLKTSFAELATTTINSDFVKGMIDATRIVLEFISSAGGLVPVLTSVLGALILIKREKAGSFLIDIKNKILSLGNSVSTFVTKLHLQKVATKGVGVEAFKARYQLRQMELATKATASAASLLSNVLGVAIIAISLISMGIQKYNAEQEKTLQTNIELNNKRKEELDTLEGLKKEYIDLSVITNKSETQKNRLDTISKQLIKTYGLEADAINLLEDSYDSATEKFRKMEAAKLKDAEIQNKITINNIKKNLVKQQGNTTPLPSYLNPLGSGEDEFNDAYSDDPLKVYAYYERQYNKLEKLPTRTRQQQKEMDRLGRNIINQKELIVQYQDLLDENKRITERLAILANKTTSKLIDDFAKDMVKFSIEPIEKQIDLMDGLEKRIAELKLNDLYKDNAEYKVEIDKLTEAFEKQAEAVKNTDFALKAMDEKLAILKKQEKLEQEELKTQEKLLAVEKAREELAKAKDKRIRIFRAEKGFVYEKDFSAVEGAQKNLDKAEMDIGGSSTSQAIKEIEKLQALYNQAQLEQSQNDKTDLRKYFRNKENLDTWKSMSLADKTAFLENYISNKDWNKPMDKEDIANWVPQGVETKHNGGFVGDSNSQKSSGSLKPNEQFAKLMKGEFVATRGMQNNVVKNFNNKQSESGVVNNIGTINLPNVQDYSGFVNALKRIGTSSLQTVTSRR